MKYLPLAVKQQTINQYTIPPVDKGHSREPENVPFLYSCPVYTG